MVREAAIDQRRGHHLVVEHLSPILQALVRGQHCRCLLMPRVDQLEEQYRPLPAHRQV